MPSIHHHPFHLEPQKIHFVNRAKDLPSGSAMAAPALNNQQTQNQINRPTEAFHNISDHVLSVNYMFNVKK